MKKSRTRFNRILRKLRHAIRMQANKERWPTGEKRRALKGVVVTAAQLEGKAKALSDADFELLMQRM